MTKRTKLNSAILACLLFVGSGTAMAQSDELLDFIKERAERLNQIDHFVVRIKSISFAATAMQDDSCAVAANCQVFDVVADVPLMGRVERQMSALEVATLAGQSLSADELEAMGAGYIYGQQAFNEATTGSADPSGSLGTLNEYFSNNDMTDAERQQKKDEIGRQEPWADPFAMMGAGGFMMLDTAKAVRDAENTVANSDTIAANEANQQQNIMAQLELRGIEEYAGVQATRYDSTAPPASMGEVDGQEVISKSLSVWVDHNRELMIGHHYGGTFIENGESRDFYVNVTNSDFRNPPGCYDLVKPFRTDIEMGGMLNDEQMAQMEEARQQLAEFDKQLAEMPASQRQMMESMMGGQMETMRNMAESGMFSHTVETEEILCNPDLKALFSTPMGGREALLGAGAGGSVGEVQPSGAVLVKQIQVDLTTLGYGPGNTDGVLDTMTQVAISQFQAETGLAVTGEPSPELAKALAAAAGR